MMQTQRQALIEINLLDKALSQRLGKKHLVTAHFGAKTPGKSRTKMKSFSCFEIEYDRHAEKVAHFHGRPKSYTTPAAPLTGNRRILLVRAYTRWRNPVD